MKFENNEFSVLIYDLTQEKKGNLDKLLAHFSEETPFSTIILQRNQSYSPENCSLPIKEIKDQISIKGGQVFISSPRGLVRYEKGKFKVQPATENPPANWQSLLDDFNKENPQRPLALYLNSHDLTRAENVPLLKDQNLLVMCPQEKEEDFPQGFLYGVQLDETPHFMKRFLKGELRSSEIEIESHLDSIFQRIFQINHHDFSQYKKKTLIRRIEKRMSFLGLSSIQDFMDLLEKDNREVVKLYQEFLIGVTSFFRDRDTFEYIKNQWLPQFLGSLEDSEIRIWVPACSSGEEVYSWAMMLLDYQEQHNPSLGIRVFGSDIDQKALEKAREGLYPAEIAEDITPEYLEKYFMKERTGFRVRKFVRERIVFAEQDLIHDPPYSRVNIISCRNLMIYLNKDLQEQVLTMFHYALLPKGNLLLGNSESLGSMANLYSETSKRYKLFCKVENKNIHGAIWNIKQGYKNPRKEQETCKNSTLDLKALSEQKILQNYTPTAVIINQNSEILYIQGKAGKYLELSTGELSRNIVRIAREGLKIALANSIRKVRLNQKEEKYPRLKIVSELGPEYIDLIVTPLDSGEYSQEMMMVVFQPSVLQLNEDERTEQQHHSILELEKELSATQENLQSTIEELETTNEELKSSNEEAQSTNEELQSANEELETSREELQSVNEELISTNHFLHNKIDELSKINNDIIILLASTQIATIFLDKDMKINRFTPNILQIVELQESDKGRLFSHFTNKLDYQDIEKDAIKVLQTLIPKELEVTTRNQKNFWMRVFPYRTIKDSIEGVVITFTDITEKKKQEAELQEYRLHLEELVKEKTGKLRENEQKYRALYDNAPLAYQSLDKNGLILDVNPAWCKTLGYEQDEVLNRWFGDFLYISSKDSFKENFPAFLERGFVHDAPFLMQKKNGQTLNVSFEGIVGYTEGHKVSQTYCTFKDITAAKVFEGELIMKNKALEDSLNGFHIIHPQKGILYVNQAYAAMWGYDSPQDVLRSRAEDHYAEKNAYRNISRELEKQGKVDIQLKARRKDGSLFDVRILAFTYVNDQKEKLYMGTSLNITEQEESRRRLIESEEKYRLLIENQTDLIVKVDNKSRFLFVSQSYCRTFGKTESVLLGKTFMPMVHPDDIDSTTAAMEKLNEPPYTCYLEQRAKTIRGWRWFSWVDKAIIDEDGKIKEILGIGRDITERMQAQSALEESEHRYKMISSLSTDYSYSLLISADGSKKLEWHIGSFENLTGYNPGSLWNSDEISDLYYPEDIPQLKKHWEKLEQGKSSSLEIRILTREGKILWIRDICQPDWEKYSPEGQLRILGMAKDITEQKLYEQELQNRNQELNKTLKDLNETQDKLVHQERLAAVGQFSAGIAHDFNNILTGVVGTAELLSLDEKLSESQKEHVQTILQSGDRAAKLVRQIMDYSRKSIRQEKSLDLKKTLDESLKIIRSGITEQYKITTHTDQYDGQKIKADETQIEQLIINLVMNSRDAITGSGEIRIQLRNRYLRQNERCVLCDQHFMGDFIEISVQDNGTGMTEDIRKSIFEPFFTTKMIGKGSGLGLSQVYGIVVQYKGHIQVNTKPQKGTTISVFLPVKPDYQR